jgi:hypothetical protein
MVEADNGVGARHTGSRTYERVVVDEAGRELQDEAGVYLRGTRAVSDNRIAPGERRVERFSFAMPRRTPARALARFFYYYGPEAGRRPDTGTPFLTVNAWVDAEPK